MTAADDVEMIALRAVITGRVQGVGYRDWTFHRAYRLGLDGWVRNLRTGAVEALFSGPRPAVERMLLDCRDGPPLARVDRVETHPADVAAGDGFTVRPTV
jgi:acylphosphatase